MRHSKILVAILTVGLAGCASQQAKPSGAHTARPAATTDTGSDTPEPGEPAAEPGGEVEKADPGYAPCEKETQLECPSGYKDGCQGGLTLYHVCVKEGAQPGEPCTKEVVQQCFPGEKDACLVEPAVAKTHICFKP